MAWVGVGVVFGEAVPDGLWLVDAETVGEFGPLAVVGADRGRSGVTR